MRADNRGIEGAHQRPAISEQGISAAHLRQTEEIRRQRVVIEVQISRQRDVSLAEGFAPSKSNVSVLPVENVIAPFPVNVPAPLTGPGLNAPATVTGPPTVPMLFFSVLVAVLLSLFLFCRCCRF